MSLLGFDAIGRLALGQLVGANPPTSVIHLPCVAGAATVSGKGCGLAISMASASGQIWGTSEAMGCALAISIASASGSYVTAGYPTTVTREIWLPRPFDTGVAASWTAASEPIGIWVPVVIQPKPWTID